MRRQWSVIWAITRKDIGVWLRQPAAIGVTLLPPLGLILVMFLSAAAVGRNPIALVVQDRGPYAGQLVNILEHADAFVVHPATADQARRGLANLDVEAVVTIPTSFDAAYIGHRPDPVTIQINNLNLDFTNDLRRSLPAAIAAFYAAQPNDPIAVRVLESDLRAQDIGIVQFNLVPTLVLLLTIAGIVNSGLATAREWEDQTIKELLLAPVPRSSLIAGKILAGWLTALLVGLIVFGIAAAAGLLRPQGIYWLPTLATVALVALASVGLGVTLGALFRRFTVVSGLGINISFYLFFLSGGISVAAFLPTWVQTIAHFIPTYYGAHALQMAIFYSSSDQLGRDLLVLVGTTVVTLLVGIYTLNKRAAVV